MEKTYKYCQSCSMPLKKESNHGTNADHSHNNMYCTYCYQNGKFTEPKITCEEMQVKVRKIMKEKMPIINFLFGKSFINKIPKLERWNKTSSSSSKTKTH